MGCKACCGVFISGFAKRESEREIALLEGGIS